MKTTKKFLKKESFPVTGMTCASCASGVEAILNKTEGVFSAKVDFAHNSVLVEYDKAKSAIDLQKAVQAVGYDLLIRVDSPSDSSPHK